MTEQEIERKVSEIGQEAYNQTQLTVKNVLIRVHKEAQSRNGADVTRAMVNGVLGAIIPLAMIVAKRPKHESPPQTTKDVTEEHASVVYDLVKPETLVMAALMACHSLDKLTPDVASVQFGPQMIREAMLDWQKLFPKANPKDWLEEAMVDCVNKIEENTKIPFDEFLIKRSQSLPPSDTKH